MSEPAEPRPAGVDPPKCAVCGRPREAAFSPFCSRRCADVDLVRWMGGAYAIAGEAIDPDEQDDIESSGQEGRPFL